MNELTDNNTYREKLQKTGDAFDHVACVVSPSSHTIANITFTKIPFNKVYYDPKKMWDNTNKWYVVPISGLYQVTGAVRHETVLNNYRYIFEFALHDLTAYWRGFDARIGGNSDAGITACSREIYLEEGQKLVARFYHNVGSTRTYPWGDLVFDQENYFTLRLIRPFKKEVDLI